MIERLLGQYSYGGVSPVQVLLTEPRVFFSYLLMMVAPLPQFLEFIRAQPISSSLMGPPVTLLGFGGIVRACRCGGGPGPTISPDFLWHFLLHNIGNAGIAHDPQLPVLRIQGDFADGRDNDDCSLRSSCQFSLGPGKQNKPESFRPALSTALVFTLICLAALSFGQAKKWSPLQLLENPGR